MIKPLVSCICVTRDRRSFLQTAIQSYLSQDWPEKELVVIDDGKEPVKDLCAKVPGCNYVYLPEAEKIGTKRNLACERSRGSIIAHWDDDDWSASERLREQVRTMFVTRKAVIGYHSMLFWDGERGFRYKGASNYSLGTALCYLKSYWHQHRFIAENGRMYEDNAFVRQAQQDQQIYSADAFRTMVARIHSGNTSPKKPLNSPLQWHPVELSEFPDEFFKAIA